MTKVRYLNSSDIQKLDALLEANEKEGRFAFGWDNSDIRDTVISGSNDYWVGAFTEDDELAGICSIGEDVENDENMMILSDVYVAPEFRGGGIGSALVEMAEHIAIKTYPDFKLSLVVLEDELQDFYKPLGFLFNEGDNGYAVLSDEKVGQILSSLEVKEEPSYER